MCYILKRALAKCSLPSFYSCCVDLISLENVSLLEVENVDDIYCQQLAPFKIKYVASNHKWIYKQIVGKYKEN